MSEQIKKKIKLNHDCDDYKELQNIFFRLNTFYTFLVSKKHITSFESLRQPIEESIKRPLQIQDLAKIAVLMPGLVTYKYVDMNQYHPESKIFNFNSSSYQQKNKDIFKLKLEDTQMLLFEFIDNNIPISLSRSNFISDSTTHQYSIDQMKKIISYRKEVFDKNINEFISQCQTQNKNPWNELNTLSKRVIPQKKEYLDPVEAMMKSNDQKVNSMCNDDNDSKKFSMDCIIESLKNSEIYTNQISSYYQIPKRIAQYGELDFDVLSDVEAALDHKNFYLHQSNAINAIHNGENVIITTSTSSGKSLVYQLSAINILIKDRNSTFIYIFPTKALAQDQKRSFQKLISNIPQLSKIIVDTYDGDTQQSQRIFLRNNARVIFTNPDTIHTSILPNHPNWKHFLVHLRLVVVDELHIYQGTFGLHVALVMRRLNRLLYTFYENKQLQFISCSATLKNPIAHMKHMFGINQVTLINEDGSPRGSKHLLVWNPPILSPKEGKRRSFISESAKILVQLVLRNVRTIAFCYVRKVCELLTKEVRRLFQKINKSELINEVMAYRGGYSASDRRKIEREMFHGNLRAVISTNALELGIDIGDLDCVVMCGFPMSMTNFHQQSGRAGRRNKDSMTIVVASDSPVDQYYVSHPENLLKHDNLELFQDLILDFNNLLILEAHIQCAAFEFPIDVERDSVYFNKIFLEKICEKGLYHNIDGYHTNNKFLPWPSKLVSLRGLDEIKFAVVDITNEKNIVIEEIEISRVNFTLYDGGIFIHQGYPYLIKEFNPYDQYAKVQRVDVDWITSQRDFTDVDPQEIEMIKPLHDSDVPVYFGKIRISMIVFGFFKIDKSNRIIDSVETYNPPVIIDSKGFWIDIPSQALELITNKRLNIPGGIHAAQHAIISVLPRFIVTDMDEIRTECKAPEKEFSEKQTKRMRPARLVFYDSNGGKYGSGLSMKTFEYIDDIIKSALHMIEECPCSYGCPNCIVTEFCKENSLVLSKPASLIIFHCILGHHKDTFLSEIKNGPEQNMPNIKIETIEHVSVQVKFAKDVKIIVEKN